MQNQKHGVGDVAAHGNGAARKKRAGSSARPQIDNQDGVIAGEQVRHADLEFGQQLFGEDFAAGQDSLSARPYWLAW